MIHSCEDNIKGDILFMLIVKNLTLDEIYSENVFIIDGSFHLTH